MDVEKTTIADVLHIRPQIWGDQRGFCVETWQQERYAAAGIRLPFVQDNHSRSRGGTLRGLHFQRRFPQGKLVSVSLGSVFDVVVDIRPDSPSFGQWYGAMLSGDNQHQLWVPPGLAHGFLVLSEVAHFHYKCTEYYHPEDEGAIRWNDPDIGIIWPESPEILLSDKDRAAPFWREVRETLPHGETR